LKVREDQKRKIYSIERHKNAKEIPLSRRNYQHTSTRGDSHEPRANSTGKEMTEKM